MGDLDVGSFGPIVAALPLVVIAFAIFALLPSSLNLLSVGADIAATRGVDVARTQRLAFLSALAGHERRRLAGGPDRLRRHRRPAPGAADDGRGSSDRAAGVGAVRRRVSRRLRPRGAHHPGARSRCRSASSRRCWEGRFSYGCSSEEAESRHPRGHRRGAQRSRSRIARVRAAAAEPEPRASCRWFRR